MAGLRGVAALAGAGCLLAVAGCTVQGSVDVLPASVSLDVVVTHTAPYSRPRGSDPWSQDVFNLDVCGSWAYDGVTKTVLPAEPQRKACRLSGTIPRGRTASGPGHLTDEILVQSAGHVYGLIPKAWFQPGGFSEPLESIDLAIRFPGRVITSTAGAQVIGSQVLVTDAAALNAQGFRVVALDADQPDLGLLALGASALAGAGLGVLATVLWSRRRAQGGAAGEPTTMPHTPVSDDAARDAEAADDDWSRG